MKPTLTKSMIVPYLIIFYSMMTIFFVDVTVFIKILWGVVIALNIHTILKEYEHLEIMNNIRNGKF